MRRTPIRLPSANPCPPMRIGERVGKRHMHDRMIVQSAEVAARPIGMAPIRAFQERPPLTPVAQIHPMIGRREHQRCRVEHLRQRAGIVLRIGRNFGDGLVSGGVDERLELLVGDRRRVDPEAVDGDAMGRRFFGIVRVGAHAERAARNPDHIAACERIFRRLSRLHRDICVDRRHGTSRLLRLCRRLYRRGQCNANDVLAEAGPRSQLRQVRSVPSTLKPTRTN